MLPRPRASRRLPSLPPIFVSFFFFFPLSLCFLLIFRRRLTCHVHPRLPSVSPSPSPMLPFFTSSLPFISFHLLSTIDHLHTHSPTSLSFSFPLFILWLHLFPLLLASFSYITSCTVSPSPLLPWFLCFLSTFTNTCLLFYPLSPPPFLFHIFHVFITSFPSCPLSLSFFSMSFLPFILVFLLFVLFLSFLT